jgi:hypothetical protein
LPPKRGGVEALVRKVYECEKCRNLGIKREPERGVVPIFMEGDWLRKKIWVVSLNPQRPQDDGIIEAEDALDFRRYYHAMISFDRRHIQFFNNIQNQLLKRCGLKMGIHVAHTDLVKCGLKEGEEVPEEAVERCCPHLIEQMRMFRPNIIVANGKRVCEWFKTQFKGEVEDDVVLRIRVDKHNIWVILIPWMISGPQTRKQKEAVKKAVRALKDVLKKAD